jgi:hypothetical protein
MIAGQKKLRLPRQLLLQHEAKEHIAPSRRSIRLNELHCVCKPRKPERLITLLPRTEASHTAGSVQRVGSATKAHAANVLAVGTVTRTNVSAGVKSPKKTVSLAKSQLSLLRCSNKLISRIGMSYYRKPLVTCTPRMESNSL